MRAGVYAGIYAGVNGDSGGGGVNRGGGGLLAHAIYGGIYSDRMAGRFFRGIIWRILQGRRADFQKKCIKVLDNFCILVYYRDSLNDSSVNIEKHIRRVQGRFFYNSILR